MRLDDALPHHPKIAALGELAPTAGWLYIAALCYCARYLTDGRIPEGALPTLAALDGHDADELAAALTRVGLWKRVRGGFLVHDFLEYNPTRATVQERRKQDSKRKKLGTLHAES